MHNYAYDIYNYVMRKVRIWRISLRKPSEDFVAQTTDLYEISGR
jgi:hypothetical protein